MSEKNPPCHRRPLRDDAHNGLPTTSRLGSPPCRPPYLRPLAVFALAATTLFLLALPTLPILQIASHGSHAPKRNLVFMVSDGMGPASLSLTRSYRQHVDGLPQDDTLVLDKHFWGSSRTRSTNSLVTDSAAGATAFACGLKTYNGAISVLPDFQPCGSVLEAAKRAGYLTGLVVTTDITDATPACFASHVPLRQMQDDIAMQLVGHGPLNRTVDLLLGGGRCHFLPNSSEGSCRSDDLDVVALAKARYGWSYADSRLDFDNLAGADEVPLPLLGLFASADVPFEMDRRKLDHIYPSLSEMAQLALRALAKAAAHSDKGFFLMIEGSRIDHAGHLNDPAAQVREILEYDKTFELALDFLQADAAQGVVVSTSDHETGGLATALQEPGRLPIYNWYPHVLANATSSCHLLAATLQDYLSTTTTSSLLTQEALRSWINRELVIPGLGITDATEEELNLLASKPESSVLTFASMISLRARIGWSTHGHSAVDVNIYSSGGPGTESIRGNVENTDIGHFLARYLGVDLEEVTKELRKKMGSRTPWNDRAAISADDAHHALKKV